MIQMGSFYKDSQLFETGKEFERLFGGRFAGSVPGGELFYDPQDGESPARLSPYEETRDSMLQLLQESIDCKQNLIAERWPPLIYELGCVY